MVPMPSINTLVEKELQRVVFQYKVDCDIAAEYPQGLELTLEQYQILTEPFKTMRMAWAESSKLNPPGWHYFYGVPVRVKNNFSNKEWVLNECPL